MRKPNIVFILVDDMGYGDFGAFGSKAVETPNLDRLAGEGVCLTQHYTGSPVCAPSRAALLTGRYPHRTGAIDTLEGRGLDRLALSEVTLGDILKSSGYATGLIGKWHLGALDPRYHPNARGFDEFVGFRGGWSDYWQWRLDYNGAFRKADGRYLTDVFTEEAVQFVQRHRSEPFFLHLTYNAPHFPLQVPDEEAKPFREKGEFTEGVSLIYGMNRRMDKGVERVLEELEGHGLSENTLVVFTSDNGPQFGGKGDMCTTRYNGDFNGCKGLVYEGGIRVPAILRWPAGLDGSRCVNDLVHFTDWLPTLAAVIGARTPEDRKLDGHNVLPVLRGEKAEVDTPRFWQWNRYTPVKTCNAAMRDGPWKLVRPRIAEAMKVAPEDGKMDRRLKYEPEGITDICRDPEPARTIPDPPPPLLFNLDEDPYEQHDLSAENPEILARMQRELDSWFESVEADRRAIVTERRTSAAFAPTSGVPSYLAGYEEQYETHPRTAALSWFREARYGLFLHYGLYSLLGRHEWVQFREKIPVAEYAKLMDKFTAEEFDAKYIASLAVDCGMKYINITTRHHDSFCLFDTKQTPFNSVKSPARRDLVAELAGGCREKGLGLFLYYSHGRDWKHPHAPNNDKWKGSARPAYDPPDPSYVTGKDHNLQLYLDFMAAQITELLTNYGPVAGVWLDGIGVPLSGDRSLFKCQELYDLIHSLQPQVLVSYKQGLLGTEDFVAPEHKTIGRPDKPGEICTTMCPQSWGYLAAGKGKHKTADEVWDTIRYARSQGYNLLLNTGPLPDGSIDPYDDKVLREVGARLRREGFPGE